MATKRLKRPRDPIALAKLIGDIATSQVEDAVEDGKNPIAAEIGRKGGEARAANLSKRKRAEIAKKGARARWKDKASAH
jgi:hypothetical protein